VFCQWLLTKCVVNTEFVANVLFTDAAGFITDSIVNLHNSHVWEDDNTYTTVKFMTSTLGFHYYLGRHLR
jgi:hypothetical protein